MNDQTRIGIGAAAVLAIAGIIAADPSLRWWVFVLIIAICVAAALWGFWPLGRKLGMTSLVYVPLPDVTRKLYGLTRGSAIAASAERSSKDAKDPHGEILHWYVDWLIQHDVPVYGVRPPSKIIEKVKLSDADGRYYFADGATRITGGYPPKIVIVYEDLVVHRLDLWRHWKKLVTEPRLRDDF